MKLPSRTETTPAIPQKSHPSILSTALVACLAYLAFALTANSWGLVLAPLSTQLHISVDTIGLLLAAWALSYLPGTLLGGMLFDRYGPRWVYVMALLLLLVGLMALYLGLLFRTTSFFVLLGCVGVAGIGGGIIDPISFSLIGGLFPEKRGSAMNLMSLLYPVGATLISLVDAVLFTLFPNDPRASLIFLVSYIAIVTISLLVVMPGRYMVKRMSEADTLSAQQKPVLFSSALLLVILAAIFFGGLGVSFRNWIPTYLHLAYGQTPTTAAVFNGVISACSSILRLASSILIARLGSWRTLVMSAVVTLGAFIAVIFSPNLALVSMMMTVALFGSSSFNVLLISVGAERVGRSYGTVSGMLLFVMGLNTAFCGWFLGWLLSKAGPSWLMIFFIACTLVGGALVLCMRPTPKDSD